jgi:hypothetical protein
VSYRYEPKLNSSYIDPQIPSFIPINSLVSRSDLRTASFHCACFYEFPVVDRTLKNYECNIAFCCPQIFWSEFLKVWQHWQMISLIYVRFAITPFAVYRGAAYVLAGSRLVYKQTLCIYVWPWCALGIAQLLDVMVFTFLSCGASQLTITLFTVTNSTNV